MSVERTLSIIKPDAIGKNVIGQIYTRFEQAGLNIIGAKMMHLTKDQAQGFYREHENRPFFDDLVKFMTSAPVLVQVLEGENAIRRYRDLMGETNPAQALAGTLRDVYASSIEQNAVHGSDSAQSAEREIAFFFVDSEIFPRT